MTGYCQHARRGPRRWRRSDASTNIACGASDESTCEWFRHRPTGAPPRRFTAGARRRPLHGGRKSARPGLCRHGAFAACPCAIARYCHRQGQIGARRARCFDRRRRHRRRAKTHSAQAVVAAPGGSHAAQQRRRAAVPSAAFSAAGRQSALCRRGGGDGGRRHRVCGEKRRRGRRDRLRGAARRGGDRCRGPAGCAACPRQRLQCLFRFRTGRCRGDRGGFCLREACDAVRDLGAARHRRTDGAARGACRIRRRDGTIYGLRRQRRRRPPEERSRHHARRGAGEGPRLDGRRRRQFRHPRHGLPGICAGRLGREETRPPGEMDHRAPRIVFERLSGARSRRRGGTRARRQGQIPRHARLEPRQSRRPHHQFRHGAKGRTDDVEHLPGAGGAFSRPRHAVEHRADAALS